MKKYNQCSLKAAFAAMALIFILNFPGHAQITVFGKVSDGSKPLTSATIYVVGTTIATTSDALGMYRIENIPDQPFQLAVSFVGYQTFAVNIIPKSRTVQQDITLTAKINMLPEIIVSTDRSKWMKVFINTFVGDSLQAAQCVIENKKAIRFAYNDSTKLLKAFADSTLVIKNESLGYWVYCDLEEFTYYSPEKHSSYGYLRFANMGPEGKISDYWNKNRHVAYLRSSMRFFRSLYKNSKIIPGYVVFDVKKTPNTKKQKVKASLNSRNIQDSKYKKDLIKYKELLDQPDFFYAADPFPVSSDYILKQDSGKLYLNPNIDALAVSFKDSSDGQKPFKVFNSILVNNNPGAKNLQFFADGGIFPVKELEMGGFWAKNEKIATLLPFDYIDSPANTQQTPLQEPMLTTNNRNLIRKTSTDTAASQAFKYSGLSIREKLYLHTDKNEYIPGDTIWFKTYLTDAFSQRSIGNHIQFVEFIGADKNRINHFAMGAGLNDGGGNIVTDTTLTPGKYMLRAYTNWMLNFGDSLFFQKEIIIGGAKNIKPTNPQFAGKNIDFQLLPESGHIVAGRQNTIGFKALSEAGLGYDIAGVVKDNAGSTITTFQSVYKGMGTFAFTPNADKTYMVVLQNGQQIAFPKIESSGTILHVETIEDTVQLYLYCSKDLEQQQYRILSFAKDHKLGDAPVTLRAGGVLLKFPKTGFPSGVAKFVLQNNKKRIVNERAFFVNNNEVLNIEIQVPQQSYHPHDSIPVTIAVKDAQGRPVTGSFSLAVTDDSQVKKNIEKDQNIVSYMLLQSDLRGTIETPGYYFTPAESDKQQETQKQALDALLLTQGFVHYNWDTTKFAHSRVVYTRTGYRQSPKILGVSLPSAPSTKKIIFSPVYNDLTMDSVLLNARSNKNGYQHKLVTQKGYLQEVVVKTKGGVPGSCSFGTLRPDTELLIDRKSRGSDRTLYQWLQEEIDFTIVGDKDSCFITSEMVQIDNKRGSICIDGNVAQTYAAYSYDSCKTSGVNAFINFLNSYTLTDIKMIAQYHTSDGRRSIECITYPTVPFYMGKTFYAPKYNAEHSTDSLPDFRSTIYWNPGVVTNKNGRARISFYAADLPANYTIWVEGMDLNSHIGVKTGKVEIKSSQD